MAQSFIFRAVQQHGKVSFRIDGIQFSSTARARAPAEEQIGDRLALSRPRGALHGDCRKSGMMNLFQCQPAGPCPGLVTLSVLSAIITGAVIPALVVGIEAIRAVRGRRRAQPVARLEKAVAQAPDRRAA